DKFGKSPSPCHSSVALMAFIAQIAPLARFVPAGRSKALTLRGGGCRQRLRPVSASQGGRVQAAAAAPSWPGPKDRTGRRVVLHPRLARRFSSAGRAGLQGDADLQSPGRG